MESVFTECVHPKTVHFSSSCFSLNTQLGTHNDVAALFSLFQGILAIDSNRSSRFN